MNAINRCPALGLLSLSLVATSLQGAEPPVAGLSWLRDPAWHSWRGEQADGTAGR
jgi:hypothetical protein